MKTKLSPTRTIAQIAVFSAFSILLYLVPGLKFPLPGLFPQWLEIHFSDMPALLAGFMMGPIQGATVIVVRTLIKLPFTSTSMVGELADLLCGLAFVLVAALIYKTNRTKGGAILALIIGMISAVIMSIFANYFILLPFFIKAFGWSAIMGMFNVIFPQATQDTFYTFYIFCSVIPFNLLRCLVCAIVTFLLYKRLQRFFNFIFTTKKNKNKPNTVNVVDETAQADETNESETKDGETKEEENIVKDETINSEEK